MTIARFAGFFSWCPFFHYLLPMEFQLPFNDKVRVRLFEPVKVQSSPCHRIVDVIGFSYEHDAFTSVDAVTAGYASQFHHPDHSCQKSVKDIKKTVDEANAKAEAKDEPPTPPPVETEVVDEAPTDLKDANSKEDQSTD